MALNCIENQKICKIFSLLKSNFNKFKYYNCECFFNKFIFNKIKVTVAPDFWGSFLASHAWIGLE